MTITWKDLVGLVPGPSGKTDFQACLDAFPVLELAKTTPQDPYYHAEGDVWTHTKMVVDELVNGIHYAQATNDERIVLFMSALLHDVSKHSTTIFREDGSIGQPGHSGKGAVDARILLWKAGAPVDVREHICRIIRVHQVPFFAFKDSKRGVTPEFIVRELSHQLNVSLLAAVAEADIRGRICADTQEVLDNIELFRELAREENCYMSPRSFADSHTALRYFRGDVIHPDYPMFQEPGSKVILMSGLPASGKNTWVSQNYPNLPVVSFDDAREELGLRHGKNEGMVAHQAIDKAKELLRSHAPFVWNATHLTDQMRGKSLNLLFSYNAEVTIVHMEKPLNVLLDRNNKRDTSLSNQKLESMLIKWEAPLPTEAHNVVYKW